MVYVSTTLAAFTHSCLQLWTFENDVHREYFVTFHKFCILELGSLSKIASFQWKSFGIWASTVQFPPPVPFFKSYGTESYFRKSFQCSSAIPVVCRPPYWKLGGRKTDGGLKNRWYIGATFLNSLGLFFTKVNFSNHKTKTFRFSSNLVL